MGTHQVTFIDRFNHLKRKFTGSIKATLIDDNPPGQDYTNNQDVPSIAALRSFNERYRLSSILPYESYDEQTGIYYNRDTIGFMLYVNPATSLSTADLGTLNGFFNQSHKADTTVQISILADPNIEPILSKWAQNKNHAVDNSLSEIFSMLSQYRTEYIKSGKWDSLFPDQPYLLRDFHLVFSYVIPTFKSELSYDPDNEDVKFLSRVKETAMGTFRSSNMYSFNLNPDLFINLLSGLFNPSKEKQPMLRYDNQNLINSQIIDDDTMALFDSGASSLIHKDQPFTVLPYHVRQFPKYWAGFNNGSLIGDFTNNVLRMPCPFIATLTVNTSDQVVIKGKVTRKSLRATQMSDSPIAKYVPQWKERKIDWDYVSDKVDSGNKLMEAFYQIVLFVPQGHELECEQALKAVYGSVGWILTKSRYIPIHSLLGALPMGLCQETKKALKLFGHFSSRLSWTCTNIAPWIAEWKGTPTPMMLFNGRKGQVLYFDPFDNDKGNFNISCSATSGSGKSFLTQEWIFSCLGNGGRAFVIDAGHSYRNLCKLLKGTYLDFSDNATQICLNPFSSIRDDDPQYFKEQLPLLKLLITQMASESNEKLSEKQKAVLEKAIMATWKKYKDKSTISKVVESLNEDTSEKGMTTNTAHDLAVTLFSYTSEGMFADYFEGKANINLDNSFVVLELDALNSTPELQSVVLLILMMRISQVMYLSGNKKQHKLCIIDEAWRLLGSGQAGDFIEEGYRVARKHGGSFMTITQKISDYYRSETARSAYANSDFKIYLRQDQGDLAEVESKQQISNTTGKIDMIKSLKTIQGKYSELAIDSPDGMAVVRFIVDPVTEKLYSTKAEEVDYIKEAQDRGINLFDAIQELVDKGKSR